MAWPVMKSVAGRFLGIERNGYVTGKVGAKFPVVLIGAAGSELDQLAVQTLTSASTGTNITASGVTVIGTSSALTYNLSSPVPGSRKVIVFSSTTVSGAVTIHLSTDFSGNFQSTAGTTFQQLVLTSNYEHMNLIGLSTSIWQILNHTSSQAPTT